MPGTFSEQATLATDNGFINQCRAALLFRAVEIVNSSAKQPYLSVNQSREIMRNAGSQAANMAWLVATGNPTISSEAPKVPDDAAVQFAVNTFLDQLT